MSKDPNDYCQNYFKGQTEEEIAKAYNQKWIEILKNCHVEKIQKLSENGCREKDKYVIIDSIANKACSAQKELNKL